MLPSLHRSLQKTFPYIELAQRVFPESGTPLTGSEYEEGSPQSREQLIRFTNTFLSRLATG